MSASKSGLIQNLLEYHQACVKVEKRVIGKRPDWVEKRIIGKRPDKVEKRVIGKRPDKVEKGVIGKRPDKNAASEKQKEILNFVKKENDAAFVKKEKDEEAEVAYYRGAASKSGEIEEAESVTSSLSHEELAEEEVGDLQLGVVHNAYDWSSDDDNIIIDAAATPKCTTLSYAGKRKKSEMIPMQSRHFQKNYFECMWQDAAFGDFAKPAVPGSAKRHARADHAQEHSSWEADPRNAGKAMPAHLEKLLQQAQLTPKGTQPLAIPKRMAELFQMSFAPKATPKGTQPLALPKRMAQPPESGVPAPTKSVVHLRAPPPPPPRPPPAPPQEPPPDHLLPDSAAKRCKVWLF